MIEIVIVTVIVIVIVLVLAANLAALYVAYQKLSRGIHKVRHEALDHANNTILQLESLLAVYAEVGPQRGLPRTRGWAASPDLLALLVSIVHEQKPTTVLECSSGLSTLVLAAALRNSGRGRVFSLEHDPAYAAKTRELLALHGLSEWAEVLDAPLVETRLEGWSGHWYALDGLHLASQADLLVIDGPPEATGPQARFPAVPQLRSMLKSGATVVLDDAARPDEQRSVERWLAMYPELRRVRSLKCEKGCVVLAVGAGG